MSITSDVLDEVRAQIDANPEALAEARERLKLVRKAAEALPGSLRSYRSGSLAAHTMLDPVNDGDGGIVLDRRSFPKLGPDGQGEPPKDVAAELQALIGPVVRETYPQARIRMSKRGPLVEFHAPLANGQDPTVDLVIALTRREGDGLWIPNLNTNAWEPSDPECHARLLNTAYTSHLSIRRKVIRLAKAWNNQFPKPAISSFTLSVWALEFVKEGMGVAGGLFALFDGAATKVENGEPTQDPAGVSAPLKYNLSDSRVASMMRTAADSLQDAFDAGNDEQAVRAALAGMFWTYLETPGRELAAAAALIDRAPTVAAASVGVVGLGATINPGRSYAGSVARVSSLKYHFDRPAARIGFLHAFKRNDPFTTAFHPPKEYKGAYALRTQITPTGTPARTVEVIFPRGNAEAPRVFVDGPTDSPHRFDDGSLCMWFPQDPAERRWVLSDGAEALLAHIAAHLLREEWFRVTGSWAGEELAHQ
ncbi:hypothetical protein [Leifsonia shinshuensis]|uniref:Type II CBASS E2 protein domain-containing protein n=1 Tax=Leifsonia shinshuensis TaxID=150026 RepID=A0A7G6YBM0_9MICO|nr:hypothetical protein [Leifsonia shinshuensis]QNE35885.1 hypothetical protein F1C12_12605 [Leifsonia shinshuensis]